MSGTRRVNADSIARLPAFSHAVVAGDLIFVSGTLGTRPGKLELVKGGVAEETRQILRNFSAVLGECDASLKDIVKVNVFLSDLALFEEMNAAYVEILGADPPARITVGRAALVLEASVEMDCVAYRPR